MSFEVFFDTPAHYNDRLAFYSCGSSPNLIKQLLNYLDKKTDSLSEINIALYLFNNHLINNKLIDLAAKEVKINVYTIPIEGYDDSSPKNIININTGKIYANDSKYGLASKIFEGHFRSKYPNYNLYFFPHIYLRSPYVKSFSRGNMPYSLHVKSLLFQHKNGNYDIALSSSNFAVRDLVKEENLIFIYNDKDYYTPAIDFFELLHNNSIHITKYDFNGDYTKYKIKYIKFFLHQKGGFMAPFYYNSSLIIEKYLISLLKDAKERIIIVGQHVCPEGFGDLLLEKSNQKVAVNILSQTFASGDDTIDKSFRNPVNKSNFINFFNNINRSEHINYYVNKSCHSKYIVIDNSVFISTFNYTPTQFVYLDEVIISEFKYNPGKSYKGIYSEVGQFVLINDLEVVNKYLANFISIRCLIDTVKVK